MSALETRQYPPTHTQTKDVAKREVGVVNDAVEGGNGKGVDAESLMQEFAADTTVTVDEVADSPLNLTTNPMQGPHPHPAYLTQTPDLPMVHPLQLVYLQPTPHGVNIIPIQAAGHTFTPYSPLGFPGHPHHPVVVHTGSSFPPRHPIVYHTPGHVYSPGPYPVYPQPMCMYTSPTYPTYYPGHVSRPDASPPQTQGMSSMDTTYTHPYRSQPRFFRPWEDRACVDNGGPASCPHKDCGGTGDQHCQLGSVPVSGQGQPRTHVPPFGDEDFPVLGADLMKLKI